MPGVRGKSGRKAADPQTTRHIRLTIKLNETEAVAWSKAAGIDGISDFVRRIVNQSLALAGEPSQQEMTK